MLSGDRLLHLFKRARGYLHRLAHRALLGRLGRGLPVPAAVWERQYRERYWDFLASQAEQDHYLAIVALLRQRGPGQRVLDIGCGWGRLAQLVPPELYERYVGVDISTAAIDQARALGLPRAEFVAANFDIWHPAERFDVIVFNESLYYAARPLDTAKRYAASLRQGGALIVSCVEYGHHDVIWDRLERYFHAAASTHVTNERGQGWRIKLLEPRTAGSLQT